MASLIYLNSYWFQVAIVSSTPYRLDGLSSTTTSSLVGIYSVYKMVSTYTGPLIQLTRVSDSVTQTFSAGSSGTLSATEINTFLNGSVGSVTIFYNQSGGTIHFTNTAASAPTIDTTTTPVTVVFNGSKTLSYGSSAYSINNATFAFGIIPTGVTGTTGDTPSNWWTCDSLLYGERSGLTSDFSIIITNATTPKIAWGTGVGGDRTLASTLLNGLNTHASVVMTRDSTNGVINVYKESSTPVTTALSAGTGNVSSATPGTFGKNGLKAKMTSIIWTSNIATTSDISTMMLSLNGQGLPGESTNVYIRSSLQAYYDFNNTSSYSGSGLIVTDLSLYNRSLTFSATPTFNPSPKSITLTNTTTAGTATALIIDYQTTGLTMEALVWRDPSSAGFTAYFSLDTGSYTNSFRHNIGGDLTTYYFGSDIGQVLYTNTAPGVTINASTWYHVVYTFTEWSSTNTTIGKCYINGVPCGTDVTQANASTNNFAATTVNRFIRLGKVSDYGGITGRFAMGRIYNKVLTEAEVKTNYLGVYNTNNNQYALPVVNMVYPFYSNVILLLHGNGPNFTSANNNPTVILDSSISNNTMNVTGAVTSNGVSKYNGSSMLFNGSSVINTSAAIASINTGAFTVEFWFYASATSNYGLVSNFNVATPPAASWNISIVTRKVVFRIGSTTVITGTATIAATTWYHYALSRTAAGAVTQYINGLADGSGTNSAAVDSANAIIYVGKVGSASFFNGNMAELVITNRVARYTAPFTPQVEPYGIREYPPIALDTGTGGATSVSTTISTTVYGRGTYIATCSTTGGAFNPSMAFDKQSVQDAAMWTTSTASYNTTSGDYIGTTYTTAGIAGEWLQLQLPSAIILKRSVFVGRLVGNGEIQNPRIFYVFASNDGTTWTQIDFRTGITSWGAGAPAGFNRVTCDIMANTTAYLYYRLVINAVQASNGNGYAALQEWRLFADTSI